MVEVTESARKELEAYFVDKEKGAVRVYLAPGGCSGPRLALALDGPNDDDAVFDESGFTFCINKELLEKVEAVKLDLNHMGFSVEPRLPLPQAEGGGCGGCAGSCDG